MLRNFEMSGESEEKIEMKKVVFAIMVMMMISALGTAVSAQKARDLFIEKANNEDTGKSGVKFRILLKRGDQRERYVAPNEMFYSGDKIKLAFDINFSGHVAMLSMGSSGKISLLFPYDGVDTAVEPSEFEQLFPAASNAWITFDDQPGTERITVLFSTNSISSIDDVLEKTKASNSISVSAEVQGILVQLNARSLRRSKSRDLSIQTVNKEATYVVAEESLLSQPTAFIIKLEHQ